MRENVALRSYISYIFFFSPDSMVYNITSISSLIYELVSTFSDPSYYLLFSHKKKKKVIKPTQDKFGKYMYNYNSTFSYTWFFFSFINLQKVLTVYL